MPKYADSGQFGQPRKLAKKARNQETEAANSYGGIRTFIGSGPILPAVNHLLPPRCHTDCSDSDWLRDRHDWLGLKTIVMTEYTGEIRGKSGTDRQFHISSLTVSPEKMARYIRDHWQVEKCLHWVLDVTENVTFRQDDCRIRKENAVANFATINHAAINLLKRVPGKKMSKPQKRRSTAWDDDYMEAIIRQ